MMMNREAREELYDPKKYYGEHYPRYKIVPIEVTYIKGGKKVYYQVIDPMFKKRIGLDVVKSLMKEGRARFIDEPTQGMGELYADPKKHRKGSWLDFVKAHKNIRTAKGLLDLKAISKLWRGLKSKVLDPKIIGYGRDTQWNKKLRAIAQAKRSTQGQTKLTGGASTSRRLSEFFDPAPKRCEPSICAALEKKGINCDSVDVPALIDSTLSCDENKKNILKEVGARKTDKYSKYAAQAKQHYRGQGKLIHASPDERAAAFAQMRADGTLRGYDPKPPKSWFNAMFRGIRNRSDVRNPASIVSNIWKKLTPQKRSIISVQAKKGKRFTYDLPLPNDYATKGTGTLRMVKPFKLAEVQVNLSIKDYLAVLKSGLFSKMKRNDGTIALVARCKSEHKNCNIFVDKVT